MKIQTMKFRTLAALSLSFAALAATSAPAEAGVMVQKSARGRLAAADPESSAHGTFRLRVRAWESGKVLESMEVRTYRMDTAPDDMGVRPEFHVWLVNSDASVSADFGAMRLHGRAHATLRLTTRTTPLPLGVSSLEDFGGGTLEVRLGTTVVLSGAVPAFVGPDDGNSEGSGASAVVRATSRLMRTAEEIRAQGFVQAQFKNHPRGTQERIRVAAVLLDRRAGPYSVVCIDGSLVETSIGTLTPHGRFGQARIVIDTRSGDAIPGGSLAALAGQTVEVRDPMGVAVLTGTFPSVEQ